MNRPGSAGLGYHEPIRLQRRPVKEAGAGAGCTHGSRSIWAAPAAVETRRLAQSSSAPFGFHCPGLHLSAIVGPCPIGFCAGLEIATFRRSMVGGASSDYE
jgi:hypothetical protein